MRKSAFGILTVAFVWLLMVGTAFSVPPQGEDDIREYMNRLESLIREKIETNVHTGRYQLQSFSIERTHWHYMLDTATGELYRMELGRKAQQSEWMLIAKGILDPGDLPPLEAPTISVPSPDEESD
ncbi:MAG TPA: hypothetical protein EYN81_04635 [Candidatus Marinimicrobia bacterium]|jgi:hypothetical protein|nr:hypothetical protein [Candidatus Neomarinimicrobiota bacterium]HIB58581.1 hypothetical protein [Candidatus Neomarinimicrobiota bacterium]